MISKSKQNKSKKINEKLDVCICVTEPWLFATCLGQLKSIFS